MQLPRLRRNFLARRTLDRIFLDLPDAFFRSLTGRAHWPPYSLRCFVGNPWDFERIGPMFLRDLRELGLLGAGTRILEVGCGCGRIASPLADDPELQRLGLSYTGMDVDRASIEWCNAHLCSRNSRFRFYHADCHNASYNPHGSMPAETYRFPHPDGSFDLILLTSVFTHVLPDELIHYLSELARLLSADGVVYASFFLLRSNNGAARRGRHPIQFPFDHGNFALSSEDFPANAVGFDEDFVRNVFRRQGLVLLGQPRYGGQDIVLAIRENTPDQIRLLEGWHGLEAECWRWTARLFAVSLPAPATKNPMLRLRFKTQEGVLRETGAAQLRAFVNDVALPVCEFADSGEHVYVQPVPSSALEGNKSAIVRFELDKGYRSSGPDRRELGVQVAFWTYCNEIRRAVAPIDFV